LQWVASPLPPPPTTNGFDVTLSGASTVRLDLTRMRVDVARPIAGRVTTDAPLTLRLAGDWAGTPVVLVRGLPTAATVVDGVLTVSVPVGTSTVEVAG